MGLTGIQSWTRNASRNDTNNCESFNTSGAGLGTNTRINGWYHFINRYYQSLGPVEYKINRCICTIRTDASGCSVLSFTCGGTKDALDNIYWKVTDNKTLDTSGMTICNYSGGWSGSLDVRLLPNTTYYVLFYATQGGNNNGAAMNGTLTITGSGTYGSPGEITANDTTFDSPINMSFASETSGGTYTVTVQLGTSAAVTLQTQDSAGTQSWTPSLSTYGSSYPNQASVDCVITVNTYFGNTLSGTKTKTVTVSFTEAQVGPETSSAFSIAPLNAGAVSGMTGYIQGYSKIRASFATANVTLKNGATVAKWSVKFGSAAEVDVAAGTATKDSDSTISAVTTVVCTVTDSRGFTASETLQTTIIPYENPALTATIKRTDSSGQEDDGGTYLRIDLSGWYSDVDGQNTQASVVRKKLASAGSFDADISINTGTTTLSGTRKLYSVANFLVSGMADAVYNVEVEITDALGNKAAISGVVQSNHWAIHFRNGGAGAAIGKASERDDELDIGTWILTCGDVVINGTSLKTLLNL